MLARFKDYVNRQHLFSQRDEVLLAVSGGRDSALLAHLMHEAGFRFTIAHCNFHLRPGDCDRDEAFVRRLAESYGVPCHVAQFDTRAVAADSGESIEEAARRLRYEYFASLNSQFHIVATAHHRDDSVETFFLNLFRGTGIAGLHGIRPVSQLRVNDRVLTVVHPLLPFSRAEIDAYVEARGLAYVEDYTNALLDARRNRIRLQLLPLLRELYPSVDATMEANMQRLADVGEVYRRYVDDLRARVIHKYESRLPSLPVEIYAVALSDIKTLDPQRTLLFELLRPYGFNAAVVDDILATRGTGRLFYSPTHVAELHRQQLLVAPICDPGTNSSFLIHHSSFTVRPWRPGDRFRPKGMNGTRLVSDFLKDLHLSRIERQYVMVQTAPDGTIRSVVGLRDAE